MIKGPRGKERIIVALDVSSLDKAGELIEKLAPYVGLFKVGLELITAEGAPRVVKFVQERGGKIFFDGKFHDIPNTIGAATRAVSALGVSMLNVHASSGIDGMMAAVANAKSGSDIGGPEQFRDTLVLAVTVLTSHEENEGHQIFGAPTKAKVLQMAKDAKLAGCDGIICSPQELKLLRSRRELKGLITVIPGTRSAGVAVGDQKRVMTPGEAVIDGADYLVAGRQVTKPEVGDPVEAAIKLCQEIEQAEKDMEEEEAKKLL